MASSRLYESRADLSIRQFHGDEVFDEVGEAILSKI